MTGDGDCLCTYHIMDVTKLQMTVNESKLLLHSQSTDLSFYPYVFMHKKSLNSENCVTKKKKKPYPQTV